MFSATPVASAVGVTTAISTAGGMAPSARFWRFDSVT